MPSIYKISIALFLQYVVITITMMYCYTGGHRYAPEVTHFILNQNYLSDLGRSVTFAGKDNPSYIFYSMTLVLVGIATQLFFIQLFQTIKSKLKYLILLLATISTIGYIGIALAPVNEMLAIHVKFARLAFFSFFITSILTQALLDKQKYHLANTLFYLLNALMFCYLLLTIFGPSSSQGVWALQIKTIAQKTMVYSQIFLSLGILIDIPKSRYRKHDYSTTP